MSTQDKWALLFSLFGHGVIMLLLCLKPAFEPPAPALPTVIQAVAIDNRQQNEKIRQQREQARLQREQMRQKQLREEREAAAERERKLALQKKAERERQQRLQEQQKAEQAEKKRRQAEELQRQQQIEQEQQRLAELDRLAELEKQRQAELKQREQLKQEKLKQARERQLKQLEIDKEIYRQMIDQHINAQWLKPETARSEDKCIVFITQNPTGYILSVDVETCTGSAAYRDSVGQAVWKSDPLPLPDNPAVFDRVLRLIFSGKTP